MEKLKLLTVKEAAGDSGIPYKLLLSAIKSGRIHSITLAKRPMIPETVLQAFIKEAKRPAIYPRVQ